MQVVEYVIPFADFLKLSAHLFIQGNKSLFVLRRGGFICYYTIDDGVLTIFKAEEPAQCRGADYYILRGPGPSGIDYSCEAGAPDMQEIERFNIVFVINIVSEAVSD